MISLSILYQILQLIDYLIFLQKMNLKLKAIGWFWWRILILPVWPKMRAAPIKFSGGTIYSPPCRLWQTHVTGTTHKNLMPELVFTIIDNIGINFLDKDLVKGHGPWLLTFTWLSTNLHIVLSTPIFSMLSNKRSNQYRSPVHRNISSGVYRQ